MSTTQDCLFCGIAEGRIPTELVREDEDTVAFQDINPQAPVHTLVIPRKHLGSLDEAGRTTGPSWGPSSRPPGTWRGKQGSPTPGTGP
jgi:histidine triad (HIT) family protein